MNWAIQPWKDTWQSRGPSFGLYYLLAELSSMTDAEQPYVYLSDGGHFDNLGIYELVRRRVRFIVAVDAEADPEYEFFSLAAVIQKCRTDFGVEIEIDVSDIRPKRRDAEADAFRERGFSRRSFALGLIHYPEPPAPGSPIAGDCDHDVGLLIYIKSSLSKPSDPNEADCRDEDRLSPDIESYAQRHPAYPHEPTIDQFFDETQFEAYRKLGETIALTTLTELQSCDCGSASSNSPLVGKLTEAFLKRRTELYR